MRRGWSKSRYWLTVSLLLGATVLVIGLMPVPLVWIVGAVLVAGFTAVAAVAGQWLRQGIRSSDIAAPVPVAGAMTGFSLALLLRGSEPAVFLVPALAVLLSGGCYLWARRHGPFMQRQPPLRPPTGAGLR